MSDENDKERTARAGGRGPQASHPEGRHATPGPAPSAPKRGVAARTMVGLSPPQPQDFAAISASSGGHAPGHEPERDPAHARTEATPAPVHDPSSYIADKLYVEPPSEVFARAQTQAASKAAPPAPPPSAAGNAFSDTLHAADMRGHREPPPQGPSFVDDALHAAAHRDRPAPRFTEEAAQTMHEHSQPRAPQPALRTSFGPAQAPEAWRNDVKRMAQRGGTNVSVRPGPTSSTPPGPGSLRLKLDAAADDEDHYRGVPKSRVGAVLAWLVILCGIGAGAAYWFDAEGGVSAVVARVQAVLQGKSAQPAVVQQPPSATAPAAAAGAAAQPPSAATAQQRPSGATQPGATAQPSAASAPEAKTSAARAAQDEQARELADPSSAGAPKAQEAKPDAKVKQPKAAAPAKPEKVEKPKHAAAPKPAKPAKPAARREPIIKVKPMSSAAPPPSSGPPAPLDVPYVPAIPDPPAPPDTP
jgi:hypothetical protein